jgi:hypothetical protein
MVGNAWRYDTASSASTTASITWVNSPGYMVSLGAIIAAGKQSITLPDGAKLHVDDVGNYRIEDKDAQVTYRANRIRDFSPHLNASDMVAQFVEYVGSLGVRRSEVLGLPLHLFIAWLIIEAASRDGDAVPSDIVPVANHPVVLATLYPKCLTCGRFIKRVHAQHRFPFCSPEHGAVYASRVSSQQMGN